MTHSMVLYDNQQSDVDPQNDAVRCSDEKAVKYKWMSTTHMK